MSKFLTPLRVQLIDEIDRTNSHGGDGQRASWILLHPLRYESTLLARLYEVPTGFTTDFVSVPRTLLTSSFLALAFKASVLHDHAYRTKSLSRNLADEMFLEAMEVDDIPHRHTLYAAVKAFGQQAYDKNSPSMWPD